MKYNEAGYSTWVNKCRHLKGRAFITRVKLKYGCTECGYKKHYAALQFHHVDPTTKRNEVGRMTTCPLSTIKTEMRKCVILCSNCHAELTEIERVKNDKPSSLCTET